MRMRSLRLATALPIAARGILKLRLPILTALLIIGSAGFAHAGSQGITGKKLLLKDNPKMVLLSKDALVAPPTSSSADPRCVPQGGSGSGASVTLSDGTNTVTLSMPCTNWATNSGATVYKYKDTAGAPKIGKIKAGLLKVVSPGMGGLPVPNGAATITAKVSVGTDTYCMAFNGMGDGSKFLVKDTVAGSCSAVCGNNVREGLEECDGSDDAACPGACQVDCFCTITLSCGNGVREGTEQCDGADNSACASGVCLGDCTCAPFAGCGDNLRQGQEECDGTDDANCVGACDSFCRCNIPIPSSCNPDPCPQPYICFPLAIVGGSGYTCNWSSVDTPCMAPYTAIGDATQTCVHVCGTAASCGGPCGDAQTCTLDMDTGLGICYCANN